jgi:hypothetical protein
VTAASTAAVRDVRPPRARHLAGLSLVSARRPAIFLIGI